MDSSNKIPDLIEQFYGLKEFLLKQNDLERVTEVSEHYRKILLLSCASYYESQIIQLIQKFVDEKSIDPRVYEFLNNKALQRQYHTFFNWKDYSKPNINSFLGLFGSDFKNSVSGEINDDDNLQKCVKAFLTLGNDRNLMVHENFLDYNLQKTFEEIVALHTDAISFIKFLEAKFNIDSN